MKVGLENNTERTKPATHSKSRPHRLGHRCIASAVLLLAFIVLLAGTAQAQTITRLDRLKPSGEPSTSTQVGGEFKVRIAFSPSATGLTSGDLEITNGTVSSFEQGRQGVLNVWYVDIAVDQSASTVTVKVPAGVVTTSEGDNEAAEESYTVVPALTGTFTTNATEPATSTFRVTLTFSQAVTLLPSDIEKNDWRFDSLDDVTITGARLSWHQKVSSTVYNYFIDPAGGVGTAVVSLPKSVVATDRDTDIWNLASSIEIKTGKRSVSFDQSTYSVDEGDGVEVKVVLNADPLNTVVIPLVATPQGGADASDFSGVPNTVTFNTGETQKSFTFRAADEGITDDGESVKIAFGTPLPGTIKRGSRSETTVTIVDDTDTTPPVLSAATVTGISLVLTYDETLDTGSVPVESAYSVRVNGGSGTAPASVSISGSAVTLTLASAVTEGQTVTVSYTVPLSNPVQNLVGLDAGALTNRAVTNNAGNTPATGQPTISGTARVGETLTASTSGIADADGLTNVSYRYQWIRVDGSSEIGLSGSTSSTYTLVLNDRGDKVKVRVFFTDDAGYSETLTSTAYPTSGTIEGAETITTTQRSEVVDPEAPSLWAFFREVPAEHDGSTAFTLQLAFSEPVEITEEQLLQALTVTGATITSVQQVADRRDRWEITVTPNSDAYVRLSLSPTTSCFAAGAICSSNGSMLQRARLSIARAPLTARFEQVPAGHYRTAPFALHLTFSEPVETTAAALEQALTVTNGTVTSVQQVDDRRDLWEITVTPDSNDDVSISLPQTTSCADDNAICTAGGWMLSEGIAVSIARTPLTAGFEQVPEGHIGIPFTLHLTFSEPIGITTVTLEQALTVTGGTMISTQQVADRRDLWEIQLQPNDADVSVSLPKTTSCADEGAICTQGGLALQDDAQADIPFSGYLMPHTLDKVSGDEQTGPASTQLAESFVVVAADEEGTALAGVIVTFTVTAGGGLLSANTDANPCTFESAKSSITAITDANGQATARLTLGSEAGTNTVAVAVAGLEPEPFTATATEQAMPHTLAKVCGQDQTGTVGQRLAKPLVVFVSDEEGAAMAGVAVSFAVTAGGGTLSAIENTTNADGYARAWLTLGSELGTNTVTATVEGLASVTFTATGQESPLASFFDGFQNGSGKRMALPDSPLLAQNAPNPFNSQTVLAYFLPAAGLVRLEVFSLTGQRVAVLHHGRQQAGFHQLRWDGRDDMGRLVASGLYLYRLVTDDTVLTRKLMLLR